MCLHVAADILDYIQGRGLTLAEAAVGSYETHSKQAVPAQNAEIRYLEREIEMEEVPSAAGELSNEQLKGTVAVPLRCIPHNANPS